MVSSQGVCTCHRRYVLSDPRCQADFVRLLWVLADKQLRSYYESVGKEDKIGYEAF